MGIYGYMWIYVGYMCMYDAYICMNDAYMGVYVDVCWVYEGV